MEEQGSSNADHIGALDGELGAQSKAMLDVHGSEESLVVVDVVDSVLHTETSRFPHSIVWNPLPVITWCCPCVGHMGIATTKGVIRDFQWSWQQRAHVVSEDHMGCGPPTRFVQLDLDRIPLPPTSYPSMAPADCSPLTQKQGFSNICVGLLYPSFHLQIMPTTFLSSPKRQTFFS